MSDIEETSMSEKKERPQDKWNREHGYITKGYRMRREVADELKAACDKAGVSQSGQIVKMMKDFIEKNKSC